MEENRIYKEVSEIGSELKKLSPYLQNPKKETKVA